MPNEQDAIEELQRETEQETIRVWPEGDQAIEVPYTEVETKENPPKEIPTTFFCKGFECTNTSSEPMMGSICDSCWLKTHDDEDAECYCNRCEEKD